MKPIGNIAGHADLSRPLSQEDIARALARASKRPTFKDAAKAGYTVEWLHLSPIARVIGQQYGQSLRALPRLVKA